MEGRNSLKAFGNDIHKRKKEAPTPNLKPAA